MFRTTAVGMILAVTSVSAFAPISFGWLLLTIAACGIAPTSQRKFSCKVQ